MSAIRPLRRLWTLAVGALALAVAAGCPSPDPVAVETGLLVVSFDAVPGSGSGDGEDGEDGDGIGSFDLAVDGLVVDADGPSGPESVAVLGDRTYAPMSDPGADGIAVALELGDHRDVVLQVAVDAPVGPGLVAVGRLGDRSVRIEVDALTLRFDRAVLAVSDAPVRARVVFDPAGWLDAVDDSGDGDDEDVLVIDPSAGAVYDDVVDEIVGSTRWVFGPAAQAPAGSSDDS